jgi:hypothetical protein
VALRGFGFLDQTVRGNIESEGTGGVNENVAPIAEGTAATASSRGNIFISYRHEDAPGQAILLRKALEQQFGPGHVFMDVALKPGENFVSVIREHLSRCDVLLALIGRNWSTIMEERTKRRALDHTDDYVRIELETALQRGSRVRVLPVLLDTVMPSAQELPRPIRRLCQLTAATLRHGPRWDDDVRTLIGRIDEICHEPPTAPPELPPLTVREPRPPDPETVAPPPDAKHYYDVAQLIARDNAVIPFLGAFVMGSEQTDELSEDGGPVTDGDELAAYLAREFQYPAEPADLAQISQYVLLTRGKVELYKALRRILTAKYKPGPVHHFFAALPAMLEDWGHPEHYQLIVTTNYDDALEQAFDEAQEPYDLAVYMAQGEHKGKFLHVSYDGEVKLVTDTNAYGDFPIDEDGTLERTVIFKVHGAVDRLRGEQPWRENYAITENDYIDYLSRSPIESLVPVQLLNKLRESHFLFLGYRVRDWNLRVFLQRVWGGQRLEPSSAIVTRADVVEKKFWSDFGVDLFDVPLTTYLDALREQLARQPAETR